MLVNEILEFTVQLKELSPLTPCDITLRASLIKRFRSQNPDKLLDHDDIHFIEHCFETRFLKTVDTVNDCLLNAGKVNQLWIRLSEQIAALTNKKYYQILFPKSTNVSDFNNRTCLTETTRPVNFYLGQGGFLYRKRGLCEHLIKNDYVLSTYRDLSQSKLSSLTVEELSRLKFCTQTNGSFIINNEYFTGFWDFLEKKSFPRLRERGEMPLYYLPYVLELIEKYHTLKSAHADYTVFKKEAAEFFNLLSSGELDSINYFYGVRIPYRESEYYLLDFLIAINKSQKYDLDDVFTSMVTWLYHINPALKSRLSVFDSVYTPLSAQDASSSSTGVVSSTASTNDKLQQCFDLILSLLTTSFELWPFTSSSISLWDRKNSVFSEAATIYQYFLPALHQNSEEELLTVYSNIYEVYFNHPPVEYDLFSWLTQPHSITRWYQMVALGQLSKIDVRWHEPEILLQSLLNFKPNSRSLYASMNLFLDELVHTYSQSYNDLLKRFRINILFADFFKKMSFSDKVNIKILLQLYNLDDAQSKFLDNCAQHIGCRLRELTVNRPGGSLQFYTELRKPKCSKLDLPTTGFHQVGCILDAFKDALSLAVTRIEPRLLEQMFTYLRSLSRPILTIGEIEGAQYSARVVDYLASPT